VKEQTDKVFMRNIIVVMVILIIFTGSIVFLARIVGFKDDSASNPSRETTTEARIAPVADVYTGEAGAAAIEAAVDTSTSEVKAAFDGSLDAEMMYGSVCTVCHGTGVAGAPIPGSPLMVERAAKGADALTQSAINGLNAMPARGGRADLSDEQVRAIVEYMIQ
jgi:cytochrome c5